MSSRSVAADCASAATPEEVKGINTEVEALVLTVTNVDMAGEPSIG